MDKIELDIAVTRKTVDALLERYSKDCLSDNKDRRDMNTTRDALVALDKDWAELRPVSRSTATDPSQSDVTNKMLLGVGARDCAALQTAISAWWDCNVKLGAQEATDSATSAVRSKWVIGALIGASLLIGIFAAWDITRSITTPMAGALAMAQAVAEGDLTTQFRAAGRDETAQLVTALSRMKDNLGNIVSDVRRNAEGVATASAQIASGNQDLSQRTEEQASALEETAASMEQLSSTVKQNAENA